ncbi:PLP-dependent aminotransferase family protein [Aneurinibacillus uraniidurans]|uniref:MocR-like pyridoxine biosynthesis transcription factor PdxR n=1 Tax=Aneurinibacillus uraniidurans TaxID=2966586 RepID=UPI00234B4333|nr:PLP-dependent aminotransferase family protein [Aneurinibacillus sp. B1]WCN39638.1 PLP-dependent aminotransferase family protein [Aneurinibacillus sp. B1]
MDFRVPFHKFRQEYRFKYLALYHAIKEAIATGTLSQGMKLPSSRDLAELYQISRGSVNKVYDMLVVDGYVDSEVGRGTFVTFQANNERLLEKAETRLKLSNWGEEICRMPLRKQTEEGSPIKVDFRVGRTDYSSFPFNQWNRFMYSEVRNFLTKQHEEAFVVEGHLPLREAIAIHLRRTRGIPASAERIVVCNGSMQVITLLAQLLINQGDPVIVEEPSFTGIKKAITSAGGVPIPTCVDGDGIQVQEWESRLLFVTPSRHFPTGSVLSQDRRRQLLDWAARQGSIIIEDDYDSEFRWGGRPVEPLKALDQEDRVVYVGTFTKTTLPDLRIGYVVLPECLVEPMVRAKQLYEPHPSTIMEQRALAAFMKSGHYERHLRRMKRVYGKKYAMFYRMLQKKIGLLFNFIKSDAGLHIYGSWKGMESEYVRLQSICRQKGVIWEDATTYFMSPSAPAACFGFSHLNEEEMEEGIRLIFEAWESIST